MTKCCLKFVRKREWYCGNCDYCSCLVGIALLFRSQITNFVRSATEQVFDVEIIEDTLEQNDPFKIP